MQFNVVVYGFVLFARFRVLSPGLLSEEGTLLKLVVTKTINLCPRLDNWFSNLVSL